jgi:hypothetical protein
MNRRTIGLIFILVLAGILACQSGIIAQTSQSTTPIIPTATVPATNNPAATPTLILPLFSYDGEWEGLTKLGLPVSFRVENNLITYFAAEYDTHTPDCHVKIEPDLPDFGSINKGSFSMSSFGSPLLGFSWHFEGTFISSSKAAGKFKAFLGSCGSVDTTWEASQK